ncbi:hemicentin-1-like [Haliotis rubra]|uniref:hemicentin-1-like n=1 Tax=Haliotis rubra TaxID=36100 RepID=UPI001EE5F9A8|nr:hemicentin-1-like [Haliotis rubra]
MMLSGLMSRHYAPVITSVPSNKDVTENTSPNIDCSSNITPGNPSTTSYRWTGPGGYSKDGAVLDRPVTRTQGGVYICTASNTPGLSDTAQVNVNVPYAPVITSVPSNKDVTENTSPIIDCSSNITPGNPSTTSYRWTGPGGYSKDGAVLDRPVTRTQGGLYICTASNTAGLSDTAQVNINVQYAPVITSVPSNKDVTENTSPNIDCSSNITPGNPSTTSYRWTGPGGYSKDGAVLDRPVTRTQGGVYICTTSNTAGLSDTAQVNINVQYAPVITSVPSNKDVTENTSPNIDCSSNITPGNPSTTSYRWTGPGGYSKDGAVLDIPVTRTQGGVYICTASNTAGLSDTAQVNINVQYGPGTSVSITPSSPHTVVEGTGPVSIRCTADCNPSCGLQLKKGTTDVGQGQVTLDKVNRAHAGDYTCEAENVIGRASKQFTLVVHYPVDISMFTVNSLSRSVTVNESDQATLTCQVDSNPKSVIRLLNGSEELTRADNSLTATYRLESADCRQRGNYSCTATNNIGAPVTQRVELLVKCTPQLDETVPKQLKYASRQGGDVNVSVSVLAYPLPTFTWSRSISTSQDLTGSSSPVSDISVTARLHLTNLQQQDFGDYNLTVDNGVGGSVTYTVSIVPTGPPNTPTNVSVSHEGPFTLHVSWKEEFNGGATQTFTVEYSTDKKDWKIAGSHMETGSENFMTSPINDLNSDKLYYVRIIARNKFGNSSYTEHVTGLTEKKVIPPGPPAGLIGGVAGGVAGVLILVVIVVVVMIVRRRGKRGEDTERITSKGRGKDTNDKLEMENDIYESAERAEMQDNVCYASSDEVMKPGTSGSQGGSEVYAAVDKKKLKPASKTNEVYAEVKKPANKKAKKQGAKKEKAKKANPKDDKTLLKSKNKKERKGEAYENTGIGDEGNPYINHAFAGEPEDVAGQAAVPPGAKAGRDDDGLLYVGIDFSNHNPRQHVHREEESTEYAGIQIGVVGPPPTEEEKKEEDK